MDTADLEKLIIRRHLRVSPEEAFDAWTVRSRMRCLLPTFEGIVGEIEDQYVFDLEVDARVGGQFFAFSNTHQTLSTRTVKKDRSGDGLLARAASSTEWRGPQRSNHWRSRDREHHNRASPARRS